jgi:O-antigen/teichoic acid export membrane protein
MALLTIPVNLFGTSVGAVLLPKISDKIDDKISRNRLLVKLYNKIYYPGLAGLIILSLLLYYLLPLLLGESWIGIGQLSAVLALGFSMQILAIPMSVVYRLINFERKNLQLTLIFTFLKIVGLYSGWVWGDFQEAVFLFVGISLIQHAIQILVIFRKLKISSVEHLANFIISLILFGLAALFIPS